MEIILKEDIIGLGFKNDIVKVKNGYANNYLLPTGKAVIASESAKKILSENLKQQAHKLQKIKESAEALGARINAVEKLVIPMKVSATGTIYGSVTNVQIADGLREKGIEVDRKKIVVGDVKSVGSYQAHVHLHKEVTATVNFDVVAEGEDTTAAPAAEEATAAPAAEAPKAEEAAPAVETAAEPAAEAAPATEAPTEDAPAAPEADAAAEEAPAAPEA